MAGRLRDLLVGDYWRYTISLLGTLILAVGVAATLLDGQLDDEELLQSVGLVVFSLLLIAAGARIALTVREFNQMGLVLGWMSLGVLVLAALTAWASVVVPTISSAFEAMFVFLSVLAAGALFGAVIGYYDVRVRGLVTRASREQARREFLDEQQETLSSLNGILRHQILNDLSAISGRAELLAAGKIETDDGTESILAHSEHMEETVDRVETLVEILTHAADPSEYELATALHHGQMVAADSEPELSVSGIDSVEALVRADELLHLAFAELFENSAIHGDGDVSVSVTTAAETVSVEVHDGGPGVELDRPFEPNTRGSGSDGDGLGLYFASLIVDRYDGQITLERPDNPTTFRLELPIETVETERSVRE
ncbi:sensor histidine kinase [Halovenus sp. HT40]|uniref:sensor histidine kinase n=1 Tax=Halovenus sp. HT40 TaxID=3126691 RepID=UPI00300E7D76